MRASKSAVSRLIGIIWLVAAATTPVGCSGIIGHYMVDAPNRGETAASLGEPCRAVLALWRIDRQFRVQVGPPAASLLVWVTDPIAEELNAAGEASSAPSPAPKGTVLVLHGWRDEMEWFSGKSEALSRHGYRTVLLDLRGQGNSTGDYFTYGVQESKDLVQVIDALEARGEIAGPIGVWGMSYGASTAIMTGMRDPRVKAVVAVAPFANMHDAVARFVRLFMPAAGWAMTDAEIGSLVEARARQAGFDANEADMAKAAAASSAPLLLMHGAWDWMVPAENSARIEQAALKAGRTVKRMVLPATGHVTIWFDVAGAVDRESAAWFDRWLPAGS